MSLTISLLGFIFGLAILLILHELGHFLAARSLKVQVDEFGIGFPPRAARLFKLGGTEFTLNWLPFGGFVRPKGENDPAVEGGLAAASPWVRLGVLFAGPGMNILIGIILAVLLFYTLGDPITNIVRIDGIAPGSPAEVAGLLPGDIIQTVNEAPVDSIDNLHAIVQNNLGVPTTLVIARGKQILTITLTPRQNPPENEGAIGILLGNPTHPIAFTTAISRGVSASVDYGRNVLALPIRMIRGQTSPEEGRGFVGYKGMFDIYQRLRNPLFFFMAVSFSLGILNLLPIPALDGGRIFLTLPEILFKRRIPPRYENMIHLIGFAVLIVLIIYINVQDFINPVKIP